MSMAAIDEAGQTTRVASILINIAWLSDCMPFGLFRPVSKAAAPANSRHEAENMELRSQYRCHGTAAREATRP